MSTWNIDEAAALADKRDAEAPQGSRQLAPWGGFMPSLAELLTRDEKAP